MFLNKVILTGYTGAIPNIRYIRPDYPTAEFPLATVEQAYTLSSGKQIPEQVEWHRIVAYGDLARFVEQYVKKGSTLLVEGKIHYRNYMDKQGIKHLVTEIIADKLRFFNVLTQKEN